MITKKNAPPGTLVRVIKGHRNLPNGKIFTVVKFLTTGRLVVVEPLTPIHGQINYAGWFAERFEPLG